MKIQVRKLLNILENTVSPPRIIGKNLKEQSCFLQHTDWQEVFNFLNKQQIKDCQSTVANLAILFDLFPDLLRQAIATPVVNENSTLQKFLQKNERLAEIDNMNCLTRCMVLMSQYPIPENNSSAVFLSTIDTLLQTNALQNVVYSKHTESKNGIRQLLANFANLFRENLQSHKFIEGAMSIDTAFILKAEMAWIQQYKVLAKMVEHAVAQQPVDKNKPSQFDPVATDERKTKSVIGDGRYLSW